MQKTAYAYARFSSDNQREESIDAQIRAVAEYCKTNDIRILQVFKDEAFSARTAQRPAFQELFGLIRTNPADYLIVHKLDRFARNRADSAFYRSKLKEAGMKLISVTERLDDTPESIIMEGLLESLNEYYSANLSRETKKGFRENILNGKRCGAKTPLGYDCVNQKLYVNKDADKVRQLFQMYADGRSFKEMVAATGLKDSTISEMLVNENYRGALVHGEYRYERAHEAIVDEATWEACQRRRHDARMNASNRAKNRYLLAGMLYCAKCGKRMVAFSSHAKPYYYCRTSGCSMKPAEKLEQEVIATFKKYMTPTEAVKDRFYRLVCKRVNSRTNAEAVRKSNIITRKRIDKLMNAIQYADEEQAEYLLKQARELKTKLMPEPKPVDVSRAACDALIDSFADFDKMGFEEQKKVLRSMVSKIVVEQDRVRLCLPDAMGAVNLS
jgi:DNA invertase Pin-like site-specific DNA recombinase